jgi:hypothetical protein
LLPAGVACLQGFHLHAAVDDPSDKRLYIDSLRLDIVVNASLALSFFILFSCVKIVYYGDGNNRVVYFVIVSSCVVMASAVLVCIISMLYLLIDSITSPDTVAVVASNATCTGDLSNILVCLLVIIIIREKNRSHVARVVERSRCLSYCKSFIEEQYSYFVREVTQTRGAVLCCAVLCCAVLCYDVM